MSWYISAKYANNDRYKVIRVQEKNFREYKRLVKELALDYQIADAYAKMINGEIIRICHIFDEYV